MRGTKGLGGEGDPQGTAETDEMPIHEFASVVRMKGDDLPRIPAETRLQGSDHIDLCFRPDRSRFRPSRAPIRDGQGPVEISHCSLSIMTHQVHGQGTRDIQGKHSSPWTKGLGGRVHARLDGDPASQRSAQGMRDVMEDISVVFSSTEPPDGGRTHLQEEPSGLLIDREMSVSGEAVSYTHLRAHETRHDLVCRLLLEKKKE